MTKQRGPRREFLKSSLGAAGAAWVVAQPAGASAQEATTPPRKPRLRFSVIGVNHGHINSQVEAVVRGGGDLVSFFAKEPDLAEAFSKKYPQARLARSERGSPE